MKLNAIFKNALKLFAINALGKRNFINFFCIFYPPINVYIYLAFYYVNKGDLINANEIDEIASRDRRVHGLEDHLTPVYYLQGHYSKAIELMKRCENFKRDSILTAAGVKPNFRAFTTKVFSPIGHMGLIDIYIKGHILGCLGDDRLVLFGPQEAYSNKELTNYWSKYLDIVETSSNFDFPSALVEKTEERIGLIRTRTDELFTLAEFGAKVQLEWEAKGFAALLSISQKHLEEGRKALDELGMPKGAWFCGLHVREGVDKLRNARNASIDSYYLAIDEVISRGGWVIRMGDRSMKKLPYKYGLIDLPFTDYNLDWMNLFVWGEGRFLIGTGSGPVVLPLCFGKGAAIANWAPLASRQWGSKDILLPKHYYHVGENRYLSPEERMSERYGYIESINALKDMGVELHDNSPEEIRDLVIQMIDSLDDNVKINQHQTEIQNRFDQLASDMKIYPTKIAHVFSNKYI
jgi:putative glycosyltransferase (TIGR04372 family)